MMTSIIISIILIACMITITPANALPEACNCVIFRLDQVQDYYLKNPQIAVMDKFIEKNEKLSLGIIGNHIGEDRTVTNKVQTGYLRGNFELAVQGWEFVDYSTLGAQAQTATLELAQAKIQKSLNANPIIFFPPFNVYNTNTIQAMKNTDLSIISSEFDKEYSLTIPVIFIDDGKDLKDDFGIYHIPQKIEYYDPVIAFDNNGNPLAKPVKTPISTILSKVSSTIDIYGYAVITLHPSDFSTYSDFTPSNNVNGTEIDELNVLINSIHFSGYKIESFGVVAHLKESGTLDNPPSTFEIMIKRLHLFFCQIFHC